MKRRIILSIALALSIVLVSLTSSDSTVGAQQIRRVRADSGVVKLGANQMLRVTAAWDLDNDGQAFVRFTGIEYAQGACNDGICKHSVSSIYNNNPTALMPGEAASYSFGESQAVRASVTSDRRNVRVTAAIIDTVTGETVTQIIMANTEGDF